MITLPRTLLDMAGATPAVAKLSNSVLLIIDAQREYVDGHLPLAGIDAALASGSELLQRARAIGTPVVHIFHRGSGLLFNPTGAGFLPAKPFTPTAGETIVEKTLANSFTGTELGTHLTSLGSSQLIVIGFMTHNCISSTVRAARDHGYACTIVAPATATRDLPDGHGGMIPAATLQAACLAGLSDTMARVVWQTSDIED